MYLVTVLTAPSSSLLCGHTGPTFSSRKTKACLRNSVFNIQQLPRTPGKLDETLQSKSQLPVLILFYKKGIKYPNISHCGLRELGRLDL